MHSLNGLSWGPLSQGIKVQIDPSNVQLKDTIALDIETDERDNFVGCGIYDGINCIYVTNQLKLLAYVLFSKKIIGYNVKKDFHWLLKTGVPVTSSQIFSDPMIMSYVVNSNRNSQGLKDVAAEELNRTRPSYKDIVGKGKAKRTLDKQEVEFVAEYCCQDAIDAWELHLLFDKRFTPAQRKLYEQIELPVYRALWDMEVKGIKIDTKRLDELVVEFSAEISQIETELKQYDTEWNPRSPKQTIEVLNKHGIHVSSTDKAALIPFKSQPIVDALLRHRRVTKLYSTYVDAFRNLKTLPYIHTTFNQVSFQQDEGTYKGIRTGRLSSSNPNLQNIPAKKDGTKLRELFIPRDGMVMIDTDYSQIEYRLLAHFSKEPALLETFRNGGDVHETTGHLLGTGRDIGKTLNFASIYGAQAGKIALTAGISEAEADTFLRKYWAVLPRVKSWIERIKFMARSQRGVSTMSGRWIPLPEILSKRKFERLHWERAAVNYVIQGSAADIIKVAMLNVAASGYNPVLQVHDELLFEFAKTDPRGIRFIAKDIRRIMKNVVQLSIPLDVDVHLGYNWKEAKE